MKKIILFFCVLTIFGCSRKNTKVIQEPTTDKPEIVIEKEKIDPIIEEEPEAPVEVPPYLVAVLEKTGCYGTCPVFEARLFSNGHLTYHGKEDVARLGLYEAWADLSLLEKVKEAAYQVGYFKLSDVYPVNQRSIDDIPITITYLNFDEKEKTIMNNYGSPKSLKNFESTLEKLLLNVDWKKVDSQN